MSFNLAMVAFLVIPAAWPAVRVELVEKSPAEQTQQTVPLCPAKRADSCDRIVIPTGKTGEQTKTAAEWCPTYYAPGYSTPTVKCAPSVVSSHCGYAKSSTCKVYNPADDEPLPEIPTVWGDGTPIWGIDPQLIEKLHELRNQSQQAVAEGKHAHDEYLRQIRPLLQYAQHGPSEEQIIGRRSAEANAFEGNFICCCATPLPDSCRWVAVPSHNSEDCPAYHAAFLTQDELNRLRQQPDENEPVMNCDDFPNYQAASKFRGSIPPSNKISITGKTRKEFKINDKEYKAWYGKTKLRKESNS